MFFGIFRQRLGEESLPSLRKRMRRRPERIFCYLWMAMVAPPDPEEMNMAAEVAIPIPRTIRNAKSQPYSGLSHQWSYSLGLFKERWISLAEEISSYEAGKAVLWGEWAQEQEKIRKTITVNSVQGLFFMASLAVSCGLCVGRRKQNMKSNLSSGAYPSATFYHTPENEPMPLSPDRRLPSPQMPPHFASRF